ncbi:MAG: hypothetical protein AB7O96_05810 [Pseudobdellovibrionaceae bacterium]
MKIAITGHSSGLGKAFKEAGEKAGHECLGFSRTNGYDISKPENRKRIIEESFDADLFINNAFNWQDSSQLEMFFEIFEAWKTRPGKIILNISSRAPEYFELPSVQMKYGVYKAALDIASVQAEKQHGRKCQIVNLKLGKMDTPAIAHIHCEKLKPDFVANYVFEVLSRKDVLPSLLTLAP